MKKIEFVNQIAAKSGLLKKQAEQVVKDVLDTIVETLAAGDEVSIPGFGTFKSRVRPARTARHPMTRAEIFVPEARVAVFKPGKLFKEALSKSIAAATAKAKVEEVAEV